MHRRFFILFLFIGASAFAQSKDTTGFVLDHTKPYVYLKFDHIGPRKGWRDEGDKGLWLRVVNNCQLSIVFRGTDLTDKPGFIIEDEVVELEPILQILSDKEIKQAKERERLR